MILQSLAELLDDDGEGGVYVQFTNIQIEEE